MNAQLKLIREAFDRLHVLNNISWTNHREKALALAVEEEKGHRGFGPDFRKYHPDAISVADAARLFVVKRIAEYLTGERMPRGKDFLNIQRSCFYCAGLVDGHRKVIRKAWRGMDLFVLANLDYCEFVKVREVAA